MQILLLKCLREHNLYGKLSKYSFYESNIHNLRHIISREGITMEPMKIEANMEWLVPTNVHEVCSFMGFIRYHIRFVEGFSKIVNLVTEL